jgi:uncharacterized membrane protein
MIWWQRYSARTWLRVLLGPMLLLWCCCPGMADTGQIVSGSITLLGKRIPLPPGEWRVATGGFGQVTGADPGPYGTIGGVLLLRSDETTAGEFLVIHTNALPVRDGWGEPAECADTGLLFQSMAEARNEKNGCSYVMAVRTRQLLHAQLPALADAKEAARVLPDWALIAGLRISDRADMVDMLYGVAPAYPDPHGWFDNDTDGEGARGAVVSRLADWTLRARAVVMAAMRDPAAQTSPLPPLTLTGTGATGAPPAPDITVFQLAMYKLASIQVVESATTFLLATGVSLDPYIGTLQMFWQSWTHMVLYVGNEMLWERPGATPVMGFATGAKASNGNVLLEERGAAPPTALAARDMWVPPSSGSASGSLWEGDITLDAPFVVEGKQVPLPFGHWRLLAHATEDNIVGNILGRVEDNRLVGVAVVYANADRRDAIFGTSSDCGRSDIAFAVVRYDTPDDGYCIYGKRLTLDQNGERYPLWHAALKRLHDEDVRLPETLLVVGSRIRTRENFIDVRYGFAETPAVADGDTRAAIEAWGSLLQQPLELGVRGRLLGSTDLPWPWQIAAVEDARIRQRHEPLEVLAASGAIDEATLTHQLEVSDAAAATPQQQRWNLWTRAAVKTGIYRVVSIVDTFGVAWLVTGSVAQTVAYGAGGQVVRPLIVYVNEIGWAHSSIGKAPASLLPVTFPEIGTDLR